MSSENFHTIGFQTRALTAALSALSEVQTLATTGSCDRSTKHLLYASVLKTDSTHPDDIYPDPVVFDCGARQLIDLVDQGFDNPRRQLMGYLVAANKLARVLMSNPALGAKLKSEITVFKHDQPNLANALDGHTRTDTDADPATEYSDLDQRIAAALEQGSSQPIELDKALSGIYENTLSMLPYRIHIHGSRRQLEAEEVRVQVRAMLLCAVRALVLWRQLGGNALQLLFKRNTYAAVCKRALGHT